MFQSTAETEASAQPMADGSLVLPDSARIWEWVKLAQPNARLVYGKGAPWLFSARSEVLELVQALQGKGLVTSHFVRGRDGETDRHLLQRTQRPWLPGMTL